MNPVQGELKQLLRQSSHYLTGLLASLALGFISFPIFTRLFSVADFGLIDFTQKIILLAVALSKCGLQNSALRFFNRDSFETDKEAARRYYSTMFFSVAMASIVVTLLFAVAVWLAPRSIVDAGLGAILILAAGLIFLRALQSMLWSFLRIEERTKTYNVVSTLMRAATIAGVCALLPWFGASIRTYFIGTLIVEAIVTAALIFPLFRRRLTTPARMDGIMMRAAFVFGMPLIVQELAGLVLDSGDRVVIRHFLGDHALGLYSVAYGLSGYVNTLLMVPLGLAILPLYMKIWTREGQEKTIEFLTAGFDAFLIVAGLILVMAAAGAHDAVLLMASARYAGADRLIPILVAGLLTYTAQVFLNAGLLIHKRTGTMASILVGSAVLNMLLNWFLVPYLGLQASALATLAAYFVCTIWLAFASFRLMPLRIPMAALVKYGFAAALAWIAASAIDLGAPLFNLAAKGIVAAATYFLLLYAIDARIRRWSLMLFRILRRDSRAAAFAMSASD
ncbi:MAG: oligosaccharide flippase family protein [Bryobacteraceae bacterium]